MKTDNNLSIRKAINVTKNFRQHGIKFEPNLKRKLSSFNRQLRDFFEVKNIREIGGVESVGDIPVVYCVDVEGLIRKIQEARKINGEDVLIKFGIDGGGGFFKITLSVIAAEHENKTERFKDGGVRRSVFDCLFRTQYFKHVYFTLDC